jgi:hypothetical protein
MDARRALSPLFGVARLVMGVIGLGLLYWAYKILGNIWGENDSGTLAYVIFAAIPGVPGALLLYLAIIGRSANGSRPRETGQ